MAPLDSLGQGLDEAVKDSQLWVVIATVISTWLGTKGYEKAEKRLRAWAKKHETPRQPSREKEILTALRELRDAARELERTMREQTGSSQELTRTYGRMVKDAVHAEARETREMLQPMGEHVAVLLELDRSRRGGSGQA